MRNVLVRDVSDETVEKLKLLAKKQGRSMSAEARRILEAEIERQDADEERQQRLDQFMAQIRAESSRVPQTDSAELIREDRDSGHGRDL
jgi:plasmid stability protein